MYELVQLSEHDFYVECPAKVGLVAGDDDTVVAIDSGSDKDAAKKVLKHIEANGWTLKAVFNTHSHADHIGGNKLLQDRTGCSVYAPGLECAFTNDPVLEPMTLFGGMPFKDLTVKFLMAQSSCCEKLTKDVLPEGMELIELPGHSFDMVGFRTRDGNVFLADCLASEETLAKYGIGYLWNAGKYIETLEKVKAMTAVKFIPAHAEVTENIADLAQVNIDHTVRLLEKITELCTSPKTFEDVLHDLFVSYGMTMNMQQYALIGSTVRSCLSYLVTEGRLAYTCEDAYVKWFAV